MKILIPFLPLFAWALLALEAGAADVEIANPPDRVAQGGMLSPDSKSLFLVYADPKNTSGERLVRVVDTATGKTRTEWNVSGHTRENFFAGGRKLLVADNGSGTVRMVDLENDKSSVTNFSAEKTVSFEPLVISPKGNFVAVAGAYSSTLSRVNVYRLPGMEKVLESDQNLTRLQTRFSADESKVTFGAESAIRSYDLKNGKSTYASGKDFFATQVEVSNDAEFAAAHLLTRARLIRLRDGKTLLDERTKSKFQEPLFSPDSRFAIFGSLGNNHWPTEKEKREDGYLWIVNLQKGTTTRIDRPGTPTQNTGFRQLVASPDSKSVGFHTTFGPLSGIVDLETAKITHTKAAMYGSNSLSFSQDGRLYAFPSIVGELTLRQVKNGDTVLNVARAMPKDSFRSASQQFSPSGDFISLVTNMGLLGPDNVSVYRTDNGKQAYSTSYRGANAYDGGRFVDAGRNRYHVVTTQTGIDVYSLTAGTQRRIRWPSRFAQFPSSSVITSSRHIVMLCRDGVHVVPLEP